MKWLNNEKIEEIRRLYKDGHTQQEIADKFKVSQPLISYWTSDLVRARVLYRNRKYYERGISNLKKENEELKTSEEKMEVMNAFLAGKIIECKPIVDKGVWSNAHIPVWNWEEYDYRIKEEPKYRPYNDTSEMIDDFCKRFGVKNPSYSIPFIWLHSKTYETSKSDHLITDFFTKYTYLDGSICGIKE